MSRIKEVSRANATKCSFELWCIRDCAVVLGEGNRKIAQVLSRALTRYANRFTLSNSYRTLSWGLRGNTTSTTWILRRSGVLGGERARATSLRSQLAPIASPLRKIVPPDRLHQLLVTTLMRQLS